MRIDDSLYASFLEEMEALDAFRIFYKNRYPGVALDREDPDVRRLMEAMALFSARTRLAAEKHISGTHRRMFQQFFPYLLNPLPSMGVIQAVPTGMLAESVFYPEGSEMAVMPESGGMAIFKTLMPLTVLPVEIREVKATPLKGGVTRLSVMVKTPFSRNDKIGTLRIFINNLDDYETSLAIHSDLEKHMKKVSVVFEEKVDETSVGEPCGVSFGMDDMGGQSIHPLERERTFFHFPWQDLFMNIEVPQPETAWSQFTICLDLAPTWPGGLNVSSELFHLFTVPVINLINDRARPVIVTGTQEYAHIAHPDMEKGFHLHSVQGVFEVTKTGIEPIEPGVLFVSAPSWETEEVTDTAGKRHQRLNVHFPQAFDAPRTLSITARWVQPWFSETLAQRMEVEPFNRATVGVKWEFAVEPVGQKEPSLQDNIDVFLRFLTLTNRAELNRNDVVDILQALGISPESRFASVLSLISDVVIQRSGKQEKGMGNVTYIYTLNFYEHGPEMEPLVAVFLKRVATILDAWIASVRIEVHQGQADRPLNDNSNS